MSLIQRTYTAEGIKIVERLPNTLFTLEKEAHVFEITIEDGDLLAMTTDIFARFRRQDGRTVHVVGELVPTWGIAWITLSDLCYAVPGACELYVFASNEEIATQNEGVPLMTVCIYAAKGKVEPTTTDDVISRETVPSRTVEGMINALKEEILGAQLMAAFARNIGEVESELDTVRSQYDGIDEALANAGVWAMRKNLLNKDAWWVNNGSANLVCGDAARYSKSGGAYMKSIKGYNIYTTEPTQEQTAGATYVYHREAGTDSSGNTWTEAWLVYRDADDGITTACVGLTGNAVITEQDGEVYDKAIQYNITANTAWGNMETLYYPQGAWNLYYKQGEAFKSYGYIVDEMQVGETYTVSCWARLTSGSEAWLKFGWGGIAQNSMGSPADCSGVSDIIKVTGTEWKRIGWTFIFNPTGAEYTETTETVGEGAEAYTRVKRSYNWNKRVMIGVHRKYTATLQLCGFRLSKGGLYGSDTVDTLKAELQALTARVAALENEE